MPQYKDLNKLQPLQIMLMKCKRLLLLKLKKILKMNKLMPKKIMMLVMMRIWLKRMMVMIKRMYQLLKWTEITRKMGIKMMKRPKKRLLKSNQFNQKSSKVLTMT